MPYPKASQVEKTWLSAALRLCVLVGLLYCASAVVARAMAAWYAHQGSLEGLRKAVEWDPGNPRYSADLAHTLPGSLEDGNVEEVVRLYETATRLGPQKASYWSELGGAYEWAGRIEDAQRAYEQGHHLFPNSPDINWKLGNFYVRAGKIEPALYAFQKALLGDRALRRPVFDLAWRASGDARSILNQMIPAEPEVFFQYLDYLSATGRMDEASAAWGRLLELRLHFEPQEAFRYLDALIASRRVEQLTAVWAALAERFPTQIPGHRPGANLVTNGGFESEILNGGLDWRALAVEGVAVSEDPQVYFEGTRSLRIEFDGKHNPDFREVFQYVPVEPSTSYHFLGYMRTQEITTDSGPRFAVLDAYDPSKFSLATESVVGTSNWSPYVLGLKTGPATRLLAVALVRSPSRKFDNQIAGTVWIDKISLTRD